MVATALQEERRPGARVSIYGFLLALFVIALFALQVMTGTPLGFAGMVSLFCVQTFITIKILGGPTTLPGASVGYFAIQHVIFSQVAKGLLLQPATDRMLAPYTTMQVYNLAIFAIMCAAVVYRIFRVETIKPIFDLELDHRRLNILAIVLTLFSLYRFYALQKFGVFEGAGGGVYVGGIVGPLRQFGFLSTLAVAAGTASVILKSEGRRCVGIWNALAIVAPILYGILSAGRQDSASSIITFVLTLYAFKFKIKPVHIGFVLVTGYILQFIVFPYSLYARGEGQVRIGAFEDRIVKAANLLMEFTFAPKKKTQKLEETNPNLPWSMQRMYYYGSPNSSLDRYSIILSTDNIVNAVNIKGPKGPDTVFVGFNMILPRFLNQDKEAIGTSSQIAHYGDGLIGESDFMTGITLGIVPEGYYAYGFGGVFWLPFIISLAYFVVYRILYRSSIFQNIYVVSLMFIASWTFSESTAAGQTLAIIQQPIYYLVSVLPLLLIAKSLTKRHKEAKFVYEADHKPATDTSSQV